MTDDVVVPPKKSKEAGAGATRSIWASDALWAELQFYARQEGYSVSKFVGFILAGGLKAYLKQRERLAEPEDKKP